MCCLFSTSCLGIVALSQAARRRDSFQAFAQSSKKGVFLIQFVPDAPNQTILMATCGLEPITSRFKSVTFAYDQLSTSLAYWLFWVTTWISTLYLLGCAPASSQPRRMEIAVNAEPTAALSSTIEAGVVFGDEAKYHCIPLSRLGVSDSDQLISVKSSCECVNPAIVEFRETTTKVARALRIDFVSDPMPSGSVAAPVNLSVDVTFELSDGSVKTASIKFLLTTIAN